MRHDVRVPPQHSAGCLLLLVIGAACGNRAPGAASSAGRGGDGAAGQLATADAAVQLDSGYADGMGGHGQTVTSDAGSSAGSTAAVGGSDSPSSAGSTGNASGQSGGSPSAGTTASNGGVTGSASPGTTGSDPNMLPTAKGTCPVMSNLSGTNVSFSGQPYTVWSGDPSHGPGPLLIYWYASGSNSMEPTWAIQLPQIQRITDAGGAVVAQVMSTQSGQSTGFGAWYAGDDDIADEVVACAMQNQKIDVRRIWTAGYKSGGLQSVHMWYARSGYLSGAISYSGGEVVRGTLQDPSHVPVGIASHGAPGLDTAGDLIDFSAAGYAWETRNPSAFIVDCDDRGGRSATALRTMMAPQAIQMLWDHPYGITPEPYANGLPADWPSTCVPPPVPANH